MTRTNILLATTQTNTTDPFQEFKAHHLYQALMLFVAFVLPTALAYAQNPAIANYLVLVGTLLGGLLVAVKELSDLTPKGQSAVMFLAFVLPPAINLLMTGHVAWPALIAALLGGLLAFFKEILPNLTPQEQGLILFASFLLTPLIPALQTTPLSTQAIIAAFVSGFLAYVKENVNGGSAIQAPTT